jgi:type IV secretion system protein VirB11
MARTLEQDERLKEKLRRELGPLILGELENPKTEDIMLNADGKVWVKRAGQGVVLAGHFNPVAAQAAMGTIAAWHETIVNYDHPILECELPIDSSRFEGLIRPVVSNPVFAIRTKASQIYTLDQYRESGIITSKDDTLNVFKRSASTFVNEVREQKLDHVATIKKAIAERKSILVVGATGSGKTTLVNACLKHMAEAAPQDRVVLIEDTAELQCFVDNYVQLKALGNVTMSDLLRATMRLNPTRIVVGEVRGGEALTLLKSWNTGHPGGVATVHANDAMAGLARIESLVAEATSSPQQTLIGEAIDLVVFIDEEPQVTAGRKVREVLAVRGFNPSSRQYEVDYL